MEHLMASKRAKCSDCERLTARRHPILDIPLCAACDRADRVSYGYVTKTRARTEFRLKSSELAELRSHEVKNPHYATAAPMQLYLMSQVRAVAATRWGSDEPYVVEHLSIPPFGHLVDVGSLLRISDADMEDFVAEMLSRMGYEVMPVGSTHRKDGGVDLVAWPRLPLPFLLAVQVKHHRSARKKTGSRDVRDLVGVVANGEFSMGLLVTNTAFTPDAEFFAKNRKKLVRLRDSADLQRWMQNDFDNETDWREMPKFVELTPGVRIEIPRAPRLILPPYYSGPTT